MASPDDRRASSVHGGNEPRSLWIVQDDDVSRAHQVLQADSVSLQDRLVEGVLDQTQITTVPRIAVDAVVNALGQAKELLGGLNHQPARIDLRAPDER